MPKSISPSSTQKPRIGHREPVWTAAQVNVLVNDVVDHESRFKSYGTAVTRTSNYTTTATTFAASTNIFTNNVTFTADGTSSYIVEFYSGLVFANVTTQVAIGLGNSGTQLGVIGMVVVAVANTGVAANLRYLWTPAAATYVLNCRAQVQAAGGPTATVYAGAPGTITDFTPAYLRVTGAG